MDGVPASLYPIDADSADALFYAVTCAEELAHPGPRAMPELSARFGPALRRTVAAWTGTEHDARICAAYDVPPAEPIEVLPVVSNVPTLVLAGSADVVTRRRAGTDRRRRPGRRPLRGGGGRRARPARMDACARRATLAFLTIRARWRTGRATGPEIRPRAREGRTAGPDGRGRQPPRPGIRRAQVPPPRRPVSHPAP